MTNSKELFNELVYQVKLQEREEIRSIIYLLLEDKFGLTKMDIMMGKQIKPGSTELLSEIVERINQHEPIQYILGKGDFYGRKFKVDRSVLIPRPETELLIRSVLKETVVDPIILDIGTGSGCIAITLALEIPSSTVTAIDISDDALAVATQNAKTLQAKVDFSKADIRKDLKFKQQFDIIVSNPPYISESEKAAMNSNVLSFEPHLALFVSDEDPLIFYKAIARQGRSLLKPNGKIFAEINERFGLDVKEIFRKEGYKQVAIERDLDSKDRVLIAGQVD